MVEQLKTFFYLPVTYFNLLHSVKKQKVFLQKLLVNALNAARKSNDGSIQDNDFRKITNYYAMGVPAILGEAFCILRRKPMDKEERTVLTYLGALTGLFDDYFDKESLSETEIKDLINNPGKVTPVNDNQKLFIQFYNKALADVVSTEQLKKAFFSVYLAQLESKKQFKSDIGKEELFNITLKKGGESLVFYRKALPHPLGEKEETMLYSLGGLMQLGNDIFDVYKDTRAGIRTLVNTTENIDAVRQVFNNLLNETFKLVEQTNYPQRNINAFIRMISLGISRCFVCLDQFEKLEKRSNKKFMPSCYSRTDLMCDMEKPANIFKSMLYHSKHCSSETTTN